MRNNIGINGVSSQIGICKVFHGENSKITYDILQTGLCCRFGATKEEVDSVINSVIKRKVIFITENNEVLLNEGVI